MTANDDNRMEDALKDALRRREAPAGFAERVLARVRERSAAKPATWQWESWLQFFRQPLVQWTALAAVSAALIAGGIEYRQVQRERAQGEAAKQQLILALRIAGSKLQLAKSKVQHAQDQNENQEEKE